MALDRAVYCNIPYSSLVINPDGSYRLCSLTNHQDYDMGGCKEIDTGVEMNVFTHSFEDALSSKWHTYLRDQHSCGKKSELCECCYNRDAIGGDSRRTHLMRILPQNIAGFPTPENSEALTVEGKFIGKVRSLDLRFGNLCNYQCVTCGPWYSDKWYPEFQSFYGQTDFPWNGKRIEIKGERLGTGMVGDTKTPWWESDIWWERFDASAENLRHIYFTGGEPMLIKAHVTMLERLVERGLAPNVIIELDTNLSALNDHIMDLWPHFRKVDLRVSVDDVNKRYELMRYPGKFNVFHDNILEITRGSRDMSNVDVLMTACITPLNVFYLHEIEEYSKSVGIKRAAHFRFVDSPAHLDLRVFNTPQRTAMIEHLMDYPDHKWPKKVIDYLMAPHNQNKSDPQIADRFFRFMDFLDGTRGTDWKSLYPGTAALRSL